MKSIEAIDKENSKKAYFAMLERGFRQVEEGRCVPHDLIEDDADYIAMINQRMADIDAGEK